MISKLYEKLKNFIKNNYKFLLVYLLLLVICLYPLPYYIYTGGGIISLNKRIEVENEYKEKGSFNLAYVREIKATIPTYLISYIMNWDRENINDFKLNENETKDDLWKRDRMELEQSINYAIINAYQRAGENITIKGEIYKVLSIEKGAKTNLLINDSIVEVDNKKVKNYEDIKNSLVNKNAGDILKLKVLRNNSEIECNANVITVDNTKKIGVYISKTIDYEVKRKVDLDFTSREGGSSGGFMLSLAIYNRLIKEDLTKGLKIVGTGTIDSDGNVGEIGGVKYKLAGAVNSNADIFFAPSGNNYEDALKEKEKHNYKITIIEVKNLTDAINYLESR